jgi:hypothetical protein
MQEEHALLGDHLLTRRNRPLNFTLTRIDRAHEALDRLNISRETLHAFDVGYFSGKGIMHDKVVIPFHSREGTLLAYVGYSVSTGRFTYPRPEHFDPRLELFNAFRAEHAGLYMDAVVVVSDIWNVLRLHDLGVRRVVALPTDEIYAPQLEQIHRLAGSGGNVHYVPWTREYDLNLARLAEQFHVRLHRYHDGSEDEFLAEVAHSLSEW